MDKKARTEIESGKPVSIIHINKDGSTGETEHYNMENIAFSEVQMRLLSKALLDACERFYADPENMKKFEAWKAERDKHVSKM